MDAAGRRTEQQDASFQNLLLSWYAEHARDLPWRREPTPYHVWVSEIMLQQTRVEAVKPYYHRFLAALPDIAALSLCPEDRLLKLWEGLGYYSRVRNLQKAANVVMRDYAGRLPAEYNLLRKLPGIGPYTAGAIASIAYGLAVPAIDGNVMRVVSRLTGSELEISSKEAKAAAESWLKERMPDDAWGRTGEEREEDPDTHSGRAYNAPGAFNQAMMELGATVCIPNGTPLCESCPVQGLCIANREGLTDRIPVKATKRARRVEKRTVLVIRDGVLAAFRKRPPKGLLAGLYELPSLEGHQRQEAVLEAVRGMGLHPVRIQPLEPGKHIFTHVEWDMTGYMVLVEDLSQIRQDSGLIVAEPARTQDELPIPGAFSAFTGYLNIRIGQEKFRS